MLCLKPKAIAFDWDGTLADTRQAAHEALEYALAHLGKEGWKTTRAKRDTTKSLKENFPNFFGEQAKEGYDLYLKHYNEETYKHVTAMAGAEALLKKLVGDGIKVCVISNKEKSLLLTEVERFFPDIDFYKIVGDGDAARNKPAADPIFKAFEDCDFAINPENVWMVGDAKPDSECAYNAGCFPVIIGSGRFMEEDYLEKTETKVFKDLEEFQANLGW